MAKISSAQWALMQKARRESVKVEGAAMPFHRDEYREAAGRMGRAAETHRERLDQIALAPCPEYCGHPAAWTAADIASGIAPRGAKVGMLKRIDAQNVYTIDPDADVVWVLDIRHFETVKAEYLDAVNRGEIALDPVTRVYPFPRYRLISSVVSYAMAMARGDYESTVLCAQLFTGRRAPTSELLMIGGLRLIDVMASDVWIAATRMTDAANKAESAVRAHDRKPTADSDARMRAAHDAALSAAAAFNAAWERLHTTHTVTAAPRDVVLAVTVMGGATQSPKTAQAAVRDAVKRAPRAPRALPDTTVNPA